MSDPIDTAQDGQANLQDYQPSESSSPHLHHDSPQSTTRGPPPTDQKQRQDSEETVQDQEETSRKNERKSDGASNSEPSTSTSDLAPPQQSRSLVSSSMDTLGSDTSGSDGKDSEESRRIDLLRRGGTHSGDARSMGNVNTRTSQDGQATASSIRDRSSVPPESSSNVSPQTMNPSSQSQSQSQSPPTPTSRQVPRTSTLPQAPVLPQFPPAMTSRSIRLTKHAARKLLSETACPTCSQALHEPITLPCGHTECLSCIYSRIGADLPASSSSSYENNRPDGSPRNSNLNPRPAYKRGSSFTPKLPCSTHVPPRLPLTPSTVPCPDQTCPRSTVGRGLGLWAGHTARYTSSLEDFPAEEDVDSQGSASLGPGKPPVDGFVVGLPTHTKRLQVIGAQPRSQAHSFASIPSSTNPSSSSTGQGTNEASETSNEGLRTDVTLAKAMAVIRRYAGQPTPPASPPRRALALAALRRSPGLPGGAEYMARRGATGRGAGRNSGRSRGSSTSAYVRRSGAVGGSRGRYSSANRFNPPSAERRRSLIAFSGRREEDMESGTVNGVRAVWDTDEDDEEGDEDEYGDAEKYEDGRYSDGDGDETMAYDDGSELEDFHSAAEFDWPGGIGGAAARHIPSPTQQHQSRSSTPSGVVFPNSGRRGSEVHQSDLKRRRRNLNSNASANASNANHGGRSSQRGRTRIRQVSDVHQYAKRHDDVASGLSVGEDEWDTEDGSSIPGSEMGLEDERMQDSRDDRRESQSKSSAPLTRNLSSSSSDIDYNFHSRDHQHQSQSYSDQITASKLIDAGKAPLPTDGGIAALQSPQAGLAAMHAELVDVLECQLCYLVLYEPVTSPCGHTFCKTCLARSLDHSDRCPLCRSNLPNFAYFAEHPPNGSLVRLLTSEIELPSSEEEDSSHRHHQPQLNSLYGPQSNSSFSGLPFPTSEADESEGKKSNTWGLRPLFEERKAAVEQEERENRLSTPIFVCTLAFPGMPTVLHVFEPRYRLMIRRCLESGNPRFGMVLPSRNMSGPTPGVSEYGTMLEIRSVQMLADGRSMIETVGSYRFRLLDKGALDGYTVGHIERYDDISPEAEAELEAAAMRRNQEIDASNSTTSTNTASANASSNSNPTGNASTPAEEPESPRMPGAAPPSLLPPPSTPGTSETEREQSTEELIATCVSFIETIKSGSAPWLMTRLNSTYGPMPEPHEVEKFGYWIASVMPIDEHEKAKLLPIRSPRLRLRLVVHWIDQLRRSWWFNGGCTVS